jgi:hypothetical protein
MTRIIEDPETGNQLRVSIDRLRLYKEKSDYFKFTPEHLDREFVAYEQKMERIIKFNVRTSPRRANLDYRTNDKTPDPAITNEEG